MDENKNGILQLNKVSVRKTYGSYIRFYKLDDKVGVRIYHYETDARILMEAQQKAAEAEIAPRVFGDLFPVLDNFGDTFWGFFTEVAEIGDGCMTGEELYDAYCYLAPQLDELFGCHDDLHEENIGLIGDKVVCIDFDCMTIRRGVYDSIGASRMLERGID